MSSKVFRSFVAAAAVAAPAFGLFGSGAHVAAAAAPDLIISSLTLSSYTVYAGDKVNVTSVTKNIGGDTGWWTYPNVYYYFGTSANKFMTKFGSGMTPNANEPNGLEAGEEEPDDNSYTIPAGTAPGTYYISAKADAEDDVSESNEGNNVKSVAIRVKGLPEITSAYWQNPRYVNSNDVAVMFGTVKNISVGSTLTLTVVEDDLDIGIDEDVVTLTTQVAYSSDKGYYFACPWRAEWRSDADGDPEYYFKVHFTDGVKTADYATPEEKGEELHVSKSRMVPSYNTARNDFYYDPAGVQAGVATMDATLTDDRIPIILIHGMSGDAKPNTLNYWYGWVNSDTNGAIGYFNAGALRNHFRVYRYVYDSQDFISTNGARLAKFVNDWYDSHPQFRNRQVVLMAHSMGGLVSRYAMNSNTQFAARVHRLITLGSPHLGAQGANPTWIKYSGPDDNSWFVSSIYNTFGLHNNTAGCFDLAWYLPSEIPAEARTEAAIQAMGTGYNLPLMRKSLSNPFCGWPNMRSSAADPKCVLFGGSATNKITGMRSSWGKEAADEVSTDHLGLWAATKIYRSMSYEDGTGVGDNDGLVPLISALMTDDNSHLAADKTNLNNFDGQEVDHASYLDVAVTMDAVRNRLLTMVRGYCQPAEAVNAGAMWRLMDSSSSEPGAWQKTGVKLPALKPGKSYTVEFKDVDGWNTPAPRTFTARSAVILATTGTYTLKAEDPAVTNHPPTDIAITPVDTSTTGADILSVPENAIVGTLVGTLSATDEDENDSHVFSLVNGTGADDNGLFSISGSQLVTADTLDYEAAATRNIRVRVTDSGNLSCEKEFIVNVQDLEDSDPGSATGDSWAKFTWTPVEGATAYVVDVSACEGGEAHPVPAASLGTNAFLADQEWRYDAPAGAVSIVGVANASGSVKTAPCFYHYTGGDPDDLSAHFLLGTNDVAIVSKPFPLHNSQSVTLDFTQGAWNASGDTNRVRVSAYYRLDGGDWTLLGTTLPEDGVADVNTAHIVYSVNDTANASNIEFKLAAPGACTAANSSGKIFLRGAYVLNAVATVRGIGDYTASCRVAGYPKTIDADTTSHVVLGLPADATYFYRVTALLPGDATAVAAEGAAATTDVVAMPANLRATDVATNALTAAWDASPDAVAYEVQITSTLAQGTMETIATIPNQTLSDTTANPSGWSYSQGHVPVNNASWLCVQTTANADYHGLVIGDLPGIASPELDLSEYVEAQLVFTMRYRGTSPGRARLFYSTDDGSTWTAGGIAETNQSGIYNNRFCVLPVPVSALSAHTLLDLCALGSASTNTSIWYGDGVGIRNLSLQARRQSTPGYGASGATVDGTADTFPGLEPNTTYYFRVRALDEFGNPSAWVEASAATPDQVFYTIAPHDLSLSADTIDENAPAGTLVGTLAAEDEDPADALTYEFVPGDGDADNDYFALDGTQLRSATVFDYEIMTSRTVRVRATDLGGHSCEAAFTIRVNDLDDTASAPRANFADTNFTGRLAAVGTVEFTSIKENPDAEPPIVSPSVNDPAAFDLQWTDAHVPAYDIYTSTNLAEGFFFRRRVYTNAWTDTNVDSAVKFWFVIPVPSDP